MWMSRLVGESGIDVHDGVVSGRIKEVDGEPARRSAWRPAVSAGQSRGGSASRPKSGSTHGYDEVMRGDDGRAPSDAGIRSARFGVESLVVVPDPLEPWLQLAGPAPLRT